MVVLVAPAESVIASRLYFEPVHSFKLAHAITVEAYAAMAALRVEAFCRLVDRAIAANSTFTLHQEVQVRVAAIVTSSNDAIVGKTLDGVVTSWNEAEEDMILACLARVSASRTRDGTCRQGWRPLNVSVTASPIR